MGRANLFGRVSELKKSKVTISERVARNRYKRMLMANRMRSNYKFKNPEEISKKYAKPIDEDVGQSLGRASPFADKK